MDPHTLTQPSAQTTPSSDSIQTSERQTPSLSLTELTEIPTQASPEISSIAEIIEDSKAYHTSNVSESVTTTVRSLNQNFSAQQDLDESLPISLRGFGDPDFNNTSGNYTMTHPDTHSNTDKSIGLDITESNQFFDSTVGTFISSDVSNTMNISDLSNTLHSVESVNSSFQQVAFVNSTAHLLENLTTHGTHTTASHAAVIYPDLDTRSWTEYESIPLSSSGYRVDFGLSDHGSFDSSQELIFKVSVLVLISICGSVGNLLVIGSIIKTRHLHRPPFYFLLSMAATDLSRAGFCVPVVMATTLQGSTWGHGSAACKLFAFATSFFVFSSTLSLLAISIDRHASIVYSKAYRRRCHGLANLIVAVTIWIIAFCISFPPVLGVGEYIFIQEEAQCAYKHRNYVHSDGVTFVMLFLFTVFLTYFLYFRIYRFMRLHRRMRPLQHQPARSSNWTFVGPGANGQAFINWLNGFGGETPNRQTGQRTVQRLNFGRVVNLSTSKNEHLTRLFLTLTLVFGVTWFPYVIVSLWRIFLDPTLLPPGFVTSAAWTSYSQVALSPLTYFLAKGKVRRSSRTVHQSCPGERREFLLENKTRK